MVYKIIKDRILLYLWKIFGRTKVLNKYTIIKNYKKRIDVFVKVF